MSITFKQFLNESNNRLIDWAKSHFKDDKVVLNFVKWFGDSKVVDDMGYPLVVHHGTDKEFSFFDISKSGMGSGLSTGAIWFSDGYGTALDYGENIISVFLSIQRPYVKDFHGFATSREKLLDLVLQARKSGHDGVILKNFRDGAYTGTSFGVFSPNQIKSISNKIFNNDEMEFNL